MLDEWEIFVEGSIITKIQEGLITCDFLSLIYTRNCMASDWIEREWQTLLVKEFVINNIYLLLIKGDIYALPSTMRNTMYVDFSEEYVFAIHNLTNYLINQYQLKNKDLRKQKYDEIDRTMIRGVDVDNFRYEYVWDILGKNEGGVLYIKGTSETPSVKLDANSGLGFIKGISRTSESWGFYNPIHDWFVDYFSNSLIKKFELDIELIYYGSISAMEIFDILKILDKMYKDGWDIKINWYYHEDDDDMLYNGEDYKNLVKLPFKFIEITN